MKRGCLVGLLTWAVFAAAYEYVLRGRLPIPPLHWVSAGAGFFMAVIVGTIRTAIAAANDARSLSPTGDYTAAASELRDGQKLVVTGHIRALGQPLQAPFSGRPAVLYSYEVVGQNTMPSDHDRPNGYSGFALTPSVIDSPRGAVRLLAFPLLQGFDKKAVEEPGAVERANEYLASASWTDMRGFNPSAIYHEIKDLMTDDDGQLRKDWRLRDAPVTSDDLLMEEIVAPGEQVCATGTWSAEKRGLIPSTTVQTQLVRGDAVVATRQLWSKAIWSTVGAVIMAAVLNGILFFFVTMTR